jgi:hypothetical protein
MDTNYYLERTLCTHCGSKETLHIGKASCGWAFALHADDEIKSLFDWKKLLFKTNVKITDEYGYCYSAESMLDIIYRDHLHSKRRNRKVDGTHCIKNELGYDLVIGEFS